MQHIGFFIGDLVPPLWEKTNYIEKLGALQDLSPHSKCHGDLASSISHFELKDILHCVGFPGL